LWYNRINFARWKVLGQYTVGLNAHLLSLSQNYRGAGINQYIYNLLRFLPTVDGEGRYVAFLGEKRAQFPGIRLRFTPLPTALPPVRILWEQVFQPWALWQERVELLHSLAFVGPLFSPCPFLVTVYDLSFLHYPGSFRLWNRLYLSLFTRISVKKARRVIAISENTKRDLVKLLGVDERKVRVTYCGYDESLRPLPEAEVEEFRRRKGLPERFILFLGTIEPRKNLVRLLEAFSKIKGEGVKLVLAGGLGWGYRPILASVERLNLKEDVLLPGFVPPEEKVYWYNAAEVFVYPSLYEGFGLPPLEAMACGTPVVASKAASLPEVVGDGGVLVDPLNPDAMAEALLRLLSNPEERERLRIKGLRQAQKFSWELMAKETVSIYREALAERRPRL
jgi:glycosyltransferase involved in cell wall biosynthesis